MDPHPEGIYVFDIDTCCKTCTANVTCKAWTVDKRKGQGGRAEGGRAEAEGDALVQRAKSVVARLAAAGVLGPPALVVSRAELTASEVAQVRSR